MTKILVADITICIHRQVQHRTKSHNCQDYLQLSQHIVLAVVVFSDMTKSLACSGRGAMLVSNNAVIHHATVVFEKSNSRGELDNIT